MRSLINRFNIINEFLAETENHNIIFLSKFDFDDEFTKIDTS